MDPDTEGKNIGDPTNPVPDLKCAKHSTSNF